MNGANIFMKNYEYYTLLIVFYLLMHLTVIVTVTVFHLFYVNSTHYVLSLIGRGVEHGCLVTTKQV